MTATIVDPPVILPPTATASRLRLRLALILVAAVAVSGAAAPLIKITPMAPFRLASLRLLIAAVVLAPLALVQARRATSVTAGEWWRRAFIPGIALGLHFATWNLGVRHSRIADASL